MRRLLVYCGMLAAFSGLALAETWTGRLVDAACYSTQQSQPKEKQNPVEACDATPNTSTFAVDLSGKVYKLDAEGNRKVLEAMKNRADRQANPNHPNNPPTKHSAISVTITGVMDNDQIKVDTARVL